MAFSSQRALGNEPFAQWERNLFPFVSRAQRGGLQQFPCAVRQQVSHLQARFQRRSIIVYLQMRFQRAPLQLGAQVFHFRLLAPVRKLLRLAIQIVFPSQIYIIFLQRFPLVIVRFLGRRHLYAAHRQIDQIRQNSQCPLHGRRARRKVEKNAAPWIALSAAYVYSAQNPHRTHQKDVDYPSRAALRREFQAQNPLPPLTS